MSFARPLAAALLALLLTTPLGGQEPQPPPEIPAPESPEPEAQEPPSREAETESSGEPVEASQADPGDAEADDAVADSEKGKKKEDKGCERGGERVRFELPLSEEQGGGTVIGCAIDFDYDVEGELAVMDGEVELRYQDVKVTAQRLEMNLASGDLTAEGGVIFDQGPRRLAGTRLLYNLDDELGSVDDVVGYVTNDYYFRGTRIVKVGADTYVVEDGIFTSCSAEVPPWSFRFKSLRLQVDGYARVRGATFRAKRAPLFYLPYVLWPVREDRVSGMLLPKPGYSSRRGASLGLAYYLAMGRSYDATFQVDLFAGGAPEESQGSGSYLGFGSEFRYRPTEGTGGRFEGYGIRDPERDEVRWRIDFDHESRDLPFGFRGVVHVQDASDFDFFRDFERRGDRNSIRQLYSRGFLSKNWGSHSINILADRRETFLSEVSAVDLRQLPEIEYRMRSTQLGDLPLYFQLRSSAHVLDVTRSERQSANYGRADLLPELTVPIRSVPWLAFSMTAGARFTWWGDSLYVDNEREEEGSESDFRGESLDRLSPTARAELVGPSLSRIFSTEGKRFGRFKHVIEPRFTYQFLDDYDDQERIPLFDEIDRLPGANVGRASLVNRLLAKPADEEQGGAREILSFVLFRDYSFSDERLQRSSDATQSTRVGPVGTLLRFNPTRTTDLRFEAQYDTLFGEIARTSLSGTFALGKPGRIGVLWSTRTDPESGEIRTHQVRLTGQLDLIPRKLSLATTANFDIERSMLQLQRHILSFRGSCYTLSAEVGDYRNGARRDREFRFLVTLKNVGTFLDITGGESESF